MDPAHRSQHGSVSGYGQPTHVDTSSRTQASLADEPAYERKTHFTPKSTRGEKFITGVKAFGLVAGAVTFGALALGLLPLSLIGVGMVMKGKRLKIPGLIIAFPVVVFILCVHSLHKMRTGEDIFKPDSRVTPRQALAKIRTGEATDTARQRQVRPVANLPRAKELAQKVSKGAPKLTAFKQRVDALNPSQKQDLYDYIKKLRAEPIFQERKIAMLEYIEGHVD